MEKFEFLSGTLYENKQGISLKDHIESDNRIRYNRNLLGNKWKIYNLISSKPLIHEENTASQYSYSIVLRESNKRNLAILLSSNKEIIQFIHSEILRVYRKDIDSLSINTEKIVRKIASATYSNEVNVRRYLVTSLHARLVGLGQNLNSISLYGRNIIESELYEIINANIEPVSCGVGLKKTGKIGFFELIKITNEGSLSFYFHSTETLKKIEQLLIDIEDCYKRRLSY